MKEPETYTPLSERLQQDGWHDNFVPKYSALASAAPSKLVLAGVWLIFLPMALTSFVIGFISPADAPDQITAIILYGFALFNIVISVTILVSQTRRYLHMRAGTPENDDEP